MAGTVPISKISIDMVSMTMNPSCYMTPYSRAFYTTASSYWSCVNDIGKPVNTSSWMITSFSMAAACLSQHAW